MNEIEKMYENAGIKKDWTAIGFGDIEDCYPLFTAEKQLELVKWLFNTIYLLCLSPLQNSEDFKNDLAGLINSLWQDLPDEEKQQIKEILK